MGIVSPGAVHATIGTSGVVFAATDRPALDPKGRLHTFCHAIPGRWHIMGVTQSAGLSLRWFRDNFGACSRRWPRSLRTNLRRSGGRSTGMRRSAVGPVSHGRTHAAPRSARRAQRWSDWRPITAAVTLLAPSWKALPSACAIPSRSSREMNVPVTTIRLGGGGARSPAVASDSSRRLRPFRRSAPGGRRCCLRGSLACGSWGRHVVQRRRSLRSFSSRGARNQTRSCNQ